MEMMGRSWFPRSNRQKNWKRTAGRSVVPLLVAVLLASTVAAQKAPLQDRPGFKDPALFTRMPHYFLSYPDSVVEKPFNAHPFEIIQGGKPGRQRVEGRYWYYKYRYDESAGPIPSPIQITRNYEAAAVKIGGKVMGAPPDGGWTTLMISRDGREVWAFIQTYYGGKEYHVCMVERQGMLQEVTANAEALNKGLAENGHAEVAGIFFDFNKADLKPESKPALDEVAKLLKSNPSLRVWVVGHTDYVGSSEANVALSKARAASVVKALTQPYGIDPKRLTPFGNGPYAPVATNTTEDGRAKNRRVELVVQP
jgi:OmpA-OmpF porin, OOP family